MNKVAISSCENYDYKNVEKSVNSLLVDLGFSVSKPFEGLVKPGDTVFIKPNWVASKWRESCPHIDSIYSVITHPIVIEVVCDKVAQALKGKGKIIIGDNPSIDADFQELLDLTKIKKLESKYDVTCEVLDLRPLVCTDLKNYGHLHKMVACKGDPNGNVECNIGKESLFYGMDPTLFRGVFNEREETIKAHTGENQLYTFSKSLYDADVYISIPKLKTHHKTGVTLNLKGQVGAITNKNQLVHWQIGYPDIKGDEYPDKECYEASLTAKVTHRGAWPGNDTIWRMVSDIYTALLKKERKYFTIIDGVLAGEGQGPFNPNGLWANTLIGGHDFLITDIIATRYMGIDPLKIKYLNHFINKNNIKLENITVTENSNEITPFSNNDLYLNFKLKDNWNEIRYVLN